MLPYQNPLTVIVDDTHCGAHFEEDEVQCCNITPLITKCTHDEASRGQTRDVPFPLRLAQPTFLKRTLSLLLAPRVGKVNSVKLAGSSCEGYYNGLVGDCGCNCNISPQLEVYMGEQSGRFWWFHILVLSARIV